MHRPIGDRDEAKNRSTVTAPSTMDEVVPQVGAYEKIVSGMSKVYGTHEDPTLSEGASFLCPEYRTRLKSFAVVALAGRCPKAGRRDGLSDTSGRWRARQLRHDPTVPHPACAADVRCSCRVVWRNQRHVAICGNGSFACPLAQPGAGAFAGTNTAAGHVGLQREHHRSALVGARPEWPLHVCDHDWLELRVEGPGGCVVGGRRARLGPGQRHACAECR